MNGKQNGLLTYMPIGSPSMFYKIQGNGLGFIFANIIGIGEYSIGLGFTETNEVGAYMHWELIGGV